MKSLRSAKPLLTGLVLATAAALGGTGRIPVQVHLQPAYATLAAAPVPAERLRRDAAVNDELDKLRTVAGDQIDSLATIRVRGMRDNIARRAMHYGVIADIFESFGQPGELGVAWMLHESEGKYTAVSSKGACGLPQLMPDRVSALTENLEGYVAFDCRDGPLTAAVAATQWRVRQKITGSYLAALGGHVAGPRNLDYTLADGTDFIVEMAGAHALSPVDRFIVGNEVTPKVKRAVARSTGFDHRYGRESSEYVKNVYALLEHVVKPALDTVPQERLIRYTLTSELPPADIDLAQLRHDNPHTLRRGASVYSRTPIRGQEATFWRTRCEGEDALGERFDAYRFDEPQPTDTEDVRAAKIAQHNRAMESFAAAYGRLAEENKGTACALRPALMREAIRSDGYLDDSFGRVSSRYTDAKQRIQILTDERMADKLGLGDVIAYVRQLQPHTSRGIYRSVGD